MGKNTALCGDEVLIEADGLSAFGRIQDFDLQIHRGEVVGFAGLLGSGRTETAELLAGVAKPEQGALRMNGREVHFNSPLDAMHHKIAFCPEDRKIQGIIGDLSVRENIIIGLQAKKGMWNHIPLKEQERIADEYIKLLQIKVSSPEQLIRNLSGGNQQKAIIARWLVTQPDLLILDETTRGIDIGTKTAVSYTHLDVYKRQARAWEETHGRPAGEEDVEAVYALFEPKLFSILDRFSTPKPFAVETAAALREMGLKIGSTTGYTDSMMHIVAPKAARLGYAPDFWISPDGVGGRGRPDPYMIFENLKALEVPSVKNAVKVGDTVSDIREGVNAGVWSVGDPEVGGVAQMCIRDRPPAH